MTIDTKSLFTRKNVLLGGLLGLGALVVGEHRLVKPVLADVRAALVQDTDD